MDKDCEVVDSEDVSSVFIKDYVQQEQAPAQQEEEQQEEKQEEETPAK